MHVPVCISMLSMHVRCCTCTRVRRDLKPSNILMDRNLTAKIGDVGLARLMMEAGLAPTGGAQRPNTPSVVQDSQLVGTAAYMDP